MRGHESGMSLVEVLVALLLVSIALVPLMQLYPSTLGFGLDAEYDMRLATAATRKTEELIGLLRVPTTQTFTITVTLAESAKHAWVGASFSGVDTATPRGASGGNDGNSGTPNVTVNPRTAGTLMVGGFLWDFGTGTPTQGAGQTAIDTATTSGGGAGSNIRTHLAREASPGSAGVDLTWSVSGANRTWIALATELRGTNIAFQDSTILGSAGAQGSTSASINIAAGVTYIVIQVGVRGTAAPVAVQSVVVGTASAARILARSAGARSSELWGVSPPTGAVANPNGSEPCPDLTGCLLVWTTSTQYSQGVQGVGVLRILTVVACGDANGNNACDEGERQARYDTKVTSRP